MFKKAVWCQVCRIYFVICLAQNAVDRVFKTFLIVVVLAQYQHRHFGCVRMIVRKACYLILTFSNINYLCKYIRRLHEKNKNTQLWHNIP